MKHLFCTLTFLFVWSLMAAQQCDTIPVHEDEGVIVDAAAMDEPVAADSLAADVAVEAPISLSLNMPLSLNTTAGTGSGNGYMDRISPKYGYYTPAKEFSFAPIPLVVGGFLAKANKKNFRRARTDLEPEFHNVMDNFSQYVPLAAAWGMKAFGVEGRSSWGRFVVSNVFSAAVMAGIVNGVKYSVKELRPDGSTRNSFPSGHTATAFMAATILHKEYGLTRSPWYSVGGYSLAAMTGVMRSLNNRHWISDIMVGAGIGIISTDLGYLFADLIFKDRGIVRTDMQGLTDIRLHPSFFSGSMASTKPFGDLKIDDNVMSVVYEQLPMVKGMTRDNLLLPRLKLGLATSVSAEGAYFINPYVGFGGRLEVTTMPILADNLNVYKVDVRTPDGSNSIANPFDSPENWGLLSFADDYFDPDNQHVYSMYPGHTMMQSVDNLPLFSAQMGVYGSLPVSRRCAFGAKVLLGHRIAGSCDLDGYAGIIPEKYMEPYYDMEKLDFKDPDDLNMLRVLTSTAFESIDLDIKNSFVFTAGLNFTVLLRQNMGCKVYADYSNSKFDYTLSYTRVDFPLMVGAMMNDRETEYEATRPSASSSGKRGLNTLTCGVALQLNF